MASIIITLEEPLEKIKSSPYKIAKESKVRSNTIYEIMANKKKMINIETLATIIETMNRISKEEGHGVEFDISDILKYEE